MVGEPFVWKKILVQAIQAQHARLCKMNQKVKDVHFESIGRLGEKDSKRMS
jgi:hypothetical protein